MRFIPVLGIRCGADERDGQCRDCGQLEGEHAHGYLLSRGRRVVGLPLNVVADRYVDVALVSCEMEYLARV